MKTIHIRKEQINYVEVELDLTDFDLNKMYKEHKENATDETWTEETIESYIESLTNGCAMTDEEIEFAEYYKEMEEESYGMPNQATDTTITITN